MTQAYAHRPSMVTHLAAVAAAPLHAWSMWQLLLILNVINPGSNWNYFGGVSQGQVALAVALALAAGLAGTVFSLASSETAILGIARRVWFLVWVLSIPVAALIVFVGAFMTLGTATRYGLTFDVLVGATPALAALAAVGIPFAAARVLRG